MPTAVPLKATSVPLLLFYWKRICKHIRFWKHRHSMMCYVWEELQEELRQAGFYIYSTDGIDVNTVWRDNSASFLPNKCNIKQNRSCTYSSVWLLLTHCQRGRSISLQFATLFDNSEECQRPGNEDGAGREIGAHSWKHSLTILNDKRT